MNTFVALLRGINVGGKNILPMKELVAVCEGLGLERVRTYIQSGNVVFQGRASTTQELARDIGTAIGSGHGFTPRVFVLTVQKFHAAMVSNPFPAGESDPRSLHLFFLESSPTDPDLGRLESLQIESEEFELIDKVFYLHAPDGIGRSRLASNVGKALGVASTARNWRTAEKILSMAIERDDVAEPRSDS